MKRQGDCTLDVTDDIDDCAVKLSTPYDGSGHHGSSLGARRQPYLRRVSGQ